GCNLPLIKPSAYQRARLVHEPPDRAFDKLQMAVKLLTIGIGQRYQPPQIASQKEKVFIASLREIRYGTQPIQGHRGWPAIRRLQTDGQFGSLDDLAPLHMSSISAGANN